MAQRVGPWSDQATVEVEVGLTDDEWAVVNDWHIRFNGGEVQRGPLVYSKTGIRAGGDRIDRDSPAVQILRNREFQRQNPFSVVDLLPANRLVPNTQSPSVDLAMLSHERVDQERIQMLDQFINQRAPMSLPSVGSYLVTLDYQNFLATRQNLDVTDDYQVLQAAFDSATGKSLLLPQYDPSRGSNIEIQIPSGHKHSLGDLSSGEQEMLAMMYFVRRLSASGGILCIDEPEQHLHPTLQAALFEAMKGLANRSQVLVVSHSVNLIAASPLEGLVQVEAPTDENVNQVSRLRDNPARIDLIAALGITPADVFQSDMLLVVEGETDAQWLRALFPVELGRTHIVIAGNALQVMDRHSALESIPAGLPWLCLRDRDLMSDEERDSLMQQHARLYVWPRRAIESMFLETQLIGSVCRSVGLAHTDVEIEQWLREDAALLKQDVLEKLVRDELTRRVPPPAERTDADRFTRIADYLKDYAQVNLDRAASLNSILADMESALDQRWDNDWPLLADPKPLLARLSNRIDAFRNPAKLMSALVARAKDHPSERPIGLEEFRSRLAATIQGG
ncbi:AAA family ATPase [Mycobacterium sherrisii]